MVYSGEEEVLGQLAEGYSVSQDAYDQVAYDLPPEELALALERRMVELCWRRHACICEQGRFMKLLNCARASRVRAACANWQTRFCHVSGEIIRMMI